MRQPWPLTGRDEELAVIGRAMRRRDDSRGVVLAGAPGVGKTRLAYEIFTSATAQGRPTRWISATTSSQHLPLGALALAIGDVDPDPVHVLQHAADALLRAPGDGEPLVVIDDAQLLDELSATLIQQLVTQRLASVVLTIRTGERAPAAIEAVWKDWLSRIELQVLSAEETARLLAAALGGPVDPASARALYDLCAGNALYLRHVVAGEQGAGRLERRVGVWHWSGGFRATTELVELVGRSLDNLPPDVADLVDALALAGPIGRTAAVRVAGPTAAEQAEHAGVLRLATDGTVRLVHPLYGEARLAAMGEVRARRLRGGVVAALGDTGDSAVATLRRAALSLDSDLDADPALLTAGAQTALQLFDWKLARRLAEASLGGGGGDEAALALSYALAFGDDPQQADRVLGGLVASAEDDRAMLQSALPRAGHMFFLQADPDAAFAQLAAVRRDVRDPSMLALVDGLEAMFAAMSGDAVRGYQLARAALAVELPPLVQMTATWALAASAGTVGADPDPVGSDEIRSWSYEFGMPSLGFGGTHLAMLSLLGFVDRARRVAESFHRSSPRLGAQFTAMADCLTAMATLATGQASAAADTFGRSALRLYGSDSSGWAYLTALYRTIATAQIGDPVGARASATDMERERHPAHAILEPERMIAHAWVDAAAGLLSSAVERARDAAAYAAMRGHHGYEAYALATAVRFGDAGAAERLVELSTVVAGPRVLAAAHQAAALAAQDGVGLIAASQEFEQCGDLLAAADAAAQAAISLGTEAQRHDLLAATRRAGRLQAACGDPRTPALSALSALNRPTTLTAREQEIVALAGTGLTNREIAERLVVSARTVEGHLYRAAAKLGTADRHRLAAIMRGE